MSATPYYGTGNLVEETVELPKTEQLLFGRPVFKEGINVTVRRGGKWADKIDLGLKEVTLHKVNEDRTGSAGDKVGEAQIIGAAFLPFCYIPQVWLDLEHDGYCRTLEGLYEGMRSVYPDFGIAEEVTVIFFKPTLLE